MAVAVGGETGCYSINFFDVTCFNEDEIYSHAKVRVSPSASGEILKANNKNQNVTPGTPSYYGTARHCEANSRL